MPFGTYPLTGESPTNIIDRHNRLVKEKNELVRALAKRRVRKEVEKRARLAQINRDLPPLRQTIARTGLQFDNSGYALAYSNKKR